jgi:ATP-dependent helicase/nuclease subunit B
MLHSPSLISPAADFWDQAARILLRHPQLTDGDTQNPPDFSAVRVVVPTFAHAQLFKSALLRRAGTAFVPPRICTMSAWCALLAPDVARPQGEGARLMGLYSELRQHAWLKKLFTARRNTDLLPLAQILLTLSDELTQSLLPSVWQSEDGGYENWQRALEQLTPSARQIVSDESQLVWTIWKSQLDGDDARVQRYRQMMQLAEEASETLVWVAPAITDVFDRNFLIAYEERQPVLPILLDWEHDALPAAYAQAWPELPDDDMPDDDDGDNAAVPQNVALCPAANMEQEAQRGAQIIIDWLQAGKTNIAIVAQDRVVARRMRALLERSQVFVADETGWKLSTTRAASALVAWFDVIATRCETIVLLDFLKSPYAFAQHDGKEGQLIAIEAGLRHANVNGGWDAVADAFHGATDVENLLTTIAQQARQFAGRKTIAQWCEATSGSLQVLGMWTALQEDAAGEQVLALLHTIAKECQNQEQPFSFVEWRAFISAQLESTSFLAPASDKRVVMLPLNGAQLRRFDAVLMLGCDADHLPSQPAETLFFANGVRRELGLATRESRQRQQLRDFAALLSCNDEVVLSWQTYVDGEPNPVSPWIERLQLLLARHDGRKLAEREVKIPPKRLYTVAQKMPRPAAPHLLPLKLSASGYNSLVACPYQFFATRMLGLSGLEELSDMPEKRDYGDWLHKILTRYHEAVRDRNIVVAEREALLRAISKAVFDEEIASNAAALAYASRWEKVMPAYLDWANQHEADGWHFAFGERKFERNLRWTDGAIMLHGRLDRIDQNAQGEHAVLDYKTRNVTALREKLDDGEDRQLAFYGVLSDLPLQRAFYIALEAQRGKIADVEAPNYDEAKQALQEQLTGNLDALAQGAPLPATGIDIVCDYCAVRGLCRKGAW